MIIGDLLVAVDCWRSPWSALLDSGESRPTSSRALNLARKVQEWDSKWQRIIDSDSAWLTDQGVQHVMPVVVTPGPEWIAEDDAQLSFTPDVPRACTVAELEQVLGDDRADLRLLQI